MGGWECKKNMAHRKLLNLGWPCDQVQVLFLRVVLENVRNNVGDLLRQQEF